MLIHFSKMSYWVIPLFLVVIFFFKFLTVNQDSRLVWKENEIPAYCFQQDIDDVPRKIDLRVCFSEPMRKRIPVEYKVIGSTNDGMLVLIDFGRRTEVLLLSIEGDFLNIKKIVTSGWACQTGINDVTIEEGKIRVVRNYTPASLYTLAYSKNLFVNGQIPLLSADIDCFGNAVFEDNKLVQVNIDADYLRTDQVDNLLGIQGCFTKHYIEQSDIKKELSVPEFKTFMDRFVAECVGQQQDK